MKIFLSWSGARSRFVAEALHEWLPYVINAAEPWLSSSDIEKGARWSLDLAQELENTSIGVICLTRENLNTPWILFEAGALSRTVKKAFVCPYLFGLDTADLTGPLLQFQATKAEKEDTRRLVHTINRALINGRLADKQLDAAFDMWWPQLKNRLESAPTPTQSATPLRSDREILEEILGLARDLVMLRDVRVADSLRKLVELNVELPAPLHDAMTAASDRTGYSVNEIANLALLHHFRKEGIDPHKSPIDSVTWVIRKIIPNSEIASLLISEFTALDQAGDAESKEQQLRKIKSILRRRSTKLKSDQVKTLVRVADLLYEFECKDFTR